MIAEAQELFLAIFSAIVLRPKGEKNFNFARLSAREFQNLP